jgi:hypothetical protein
MVYDPNNKPENPYASIYANFLEQTRDHALTVVVDDALNRQMRVGAPGTGIWSWRVITWPGYLATYGDIADGFMFTRDTDMIDFFDRRDHRAYYSDGAPSIDFRYWAEKVIGPAKEGLREYSEQQFLTHVESVLAEHDDLGDDAETEHQKLVAVTKRVCAFNNVDYDDYAAKLRQREYLRKSSGSYNLSGRYSVGLPSMLLPENDEEAAELFGQVIPEQSPAERRAELLEDARRYSDTEHEASEFLQQHEELFGTDWWEISLRDWDIHFLFACYAIDLTVKLWREYEQTPEAAAHRSPGDSYIIVDGGVVQNAPALPVFDLDILDHASSNADGAAEALDLYERVMAHEGARKGLHRTLAELARFVRDNGSSDSQEKIEVLEAQRLDAQQNAAVPA